MATYKIKGKRYLRLYTAAQKTAAYNSKNDARTIADTICDLPWTRSSNDDPAVLPVHSGESEASDAKNVATRDNFDAAEFCAEHDDETFRHRVYANAACYVFKLPSAAVGKTLSSISVAVSSDPYNQYGARIAFLTNSSGEIPTKCSDVRTGGYWDEAQSKYVTDTSFYKAGFAPRTVSSTAAGAVKWLSNLQTATIEPSGGVIVGNYLFLTVQLESYIERNNFLEGASCLGVDATVVFTTAVTGYNDGDTIDCTTDYSTEFKVCKDGVLPDITGENGGVIAVNVISSGTTPRQNESLQCTDISQVNDALTADNLYAGLRTIYGKFATGDVVAGAIAFTNPHYKRYGVGFSIKQSTLIGYVDVSGGSAIMPSTLALTASSLLVPFGLPTQFKAKRIVFDWTSWLSDHTGSSAPSTDAVFNFWLHRGSYDTEYPLDILKNPAIYDASLSEIAVGDTGVSVGAATEADASASAGTETTTGSTDKWELLGTTAVSAGTATFDTSDLDGYVATLLVTAYVPPDTVANTTTAFWKGTSDFFYNAVTPQGSLSTSVYGSDLNRMVGSSGLCIPDITLFG